MDEHSSLPLSDLVEQDKEKELKISIITVNLDNAAGLERTIKSVKAQSFDGYEFIVIDGASSDDSVDVIKKYENDIDYWVSECDTGIYQAMNKGIRQAHGEYCLFLNSGDWLIAETSLSDSVIQLDGGVDIYYSDLLVSNGVKSWKIEYPKVLDPNYFVMNTISHQNSLIRHGALVNWGLYREDYRIVGDWFFFLDAIYRHKASFKHLDGYLAYYFHVGMSNSPKFDLIKEKEHEKGISEIFGIMAPSIQDLIEYRKSVYGNIIRLYGNSSFLTFLLRAYRFIARRVIKNRE